MDVKAKLLELCKQAIGLNIGNEEEYKLGGSRFGGVPDVPEDFVWPTFTTGDRYYETKERYLSFLVSTEPIQTSQAISIVSLLIEASLATSIIQD